MEIDFEFQKERKIGDFVQSFIDLFKLIYRHFVSTIFGLSALPLAGIALVYYFLSTKITFSANSDSFEDIDAFTWAGLLILALIALGLYVYGISIEYFVLLKERKSTAFSGAEVLKNFRSNLGKYFMFLIAMILALIVVFIPWPSSLQFVLLSLSSEVLRSVFWGLWLAFGYFAHFYFIGKVIRIWAVVLRMPM
jgi:hypothetical protein